MISGDKQCPVCSPVGIFHGNMSQVGYLERGRQVSTKLRINLGRLQAEEGVETYFCVINLFHFCRLHSFSSYSFEHVAIFHTIQFGKTYSAIFY